jgi:hypothetical protein
MQWHRAGTNRSFAQQFNVPAGGYRTFCCNVQLPLNLPFGLSFTSLV